MHTDGQQRGRVPFIISGNSSSTKGLNNGRIKTSGTIVSWPCSSPVIRYLYQTFFFQHRAFPETFLYTIWVNYYDFLDSHSAYLCNDTPENSWPHHSEDECELERCRWFLVQNHIHFNPVLFDTCNSATSNIPIYQSNTQFISNRWLIYIADVCQGDDPSIVYPSCIFYKITLKKDDKVHKNELVGWYTVCSFMRILFISITGSTTSNGTLYSTD